jgi:hypothetical protein
MEKQSTKITREKAIQKTNKQKDAKKKRKRKEKEKWRSGVSIPVPLRCERSALPYELHPQCCVKVVRKKKNATMPSDGIEPSTS